MLHYETLKAVIFAALVFMGNGSLLARANLHLLISADALGDKGSFDAFYKSRLFVGEEPPFYISNASGLRAFRDEQGSVYYSDNALSVDDIIAAETGTSHQRQALAGHSYIGWPEKANSAELTEMAQYLGASLKAFKLEIRNTKANAQVFAVYAAGQKEGQWPKNSHN